MGASLMAMADEKSRLEQQHSAMKAAHDRLALQLAAEKVTQA